MPDVPRISRMPDVDLMRLPLYHYQRASHVVDTPSKLAAALESIRSESHCGFDTETRPTFRAGDPINRIAVVQVAVETEVWIFRPLKMDCSAVLRQLLEDPGIIKAGIGLRQDIKHLRDVFPFKPANVVDISVVAKAAGYEATGLRHLCAHIFQCRVPRGRSRSNWEKDPLDPRQVTYAATDAWLSRELLIHFQTLGCEMTALDFQPNPEPSIPRKRRHRRPSVSSHTGCTGKTTTPPPTVA